MNITNDFICLLYTSGEAINTYDGLTTLDIQGLLS